MPTLLKTDILNVIVTKNDMRAHVRHARRKKQARNFSKEKLLKTLFCKGQEYNITLGVV